MNIITYLYIVFWVSKSVAMKDKVVYNSITMAKRMAVNTKNKASRSKKTKKRIAIKHARKAAHKAKISKR